MNLFFSPPVRTYSLILQNHQAPTVVDQLVSTGFVEFQMNPYDNSNDPFYIIYSRIHQLKFKISKLIALIEQKYQEPVLRLSSHQRQLTIGLMKDYIEDKQIDYLRYLDMQESIINEKIARFNGLAANYDSLVSTLTQINEQLDLIHAKLQIINEDFHSREFIILTGTCPRKSRYIIQRLIFRKTQGHSYIVFKDRQDQNNRDIFIVFISKGIFKVVNTKLINIFRINNAVLYELPNMSEHLISYKQTLTSKKQQYLKLLQISREQLATALKDYVVVSNTSLQYHFIRMAFLERIIYIICHSKPIGSPANHHLFTIHVPENETMPKLPVPLISVQGKHRPRTIMPRIPCLFQVNILTELYSTPKYNQILPSIFMFSTVPILFGMMFSDMGHGLMLLSIAFFLKLGPIFYLMAFMSIYCGAIYNQFFGMKIINIENLGVIKGEWGVAENGMNFENSLKMKISMVIAFVHMTFGLILKMTNQIKRGQIKRFYLDSLPKLVLMFTTIGYLVILIILKWLTNYQGREHEAPSIINSVLQLFLGYNQNRKTSILGSMQQQRYIGSILNTVSMCCILVMVFNHTFRHRLQSFLFNYKSASVGKKSKYQQLQEEEIDEQMNRQLSKSSQNLNSCVSQAVSYYYEKEEAQSELGPLQVFQYVLSLISSTTSYLRLFALSLAHSKLSALLLDFLLSTMSAHQPSISILRCFVFFGTTVGMMLALDVMECLMHVVRLHWVQWMGKFYIGTGVIFKPEIEEHFN